MKMGMVIEDYQHPQYRWSCFKKGQLVLIRVPPVDKATYYVTVIDPKKKHYDGGMSSQIPMTHIRHLTGAEKTLFRLLFQ